MTVTEPLIAEPPALSPLSRMVRIFTRPADAWTGLETRAQWWIPLLVSVVVWVTLHYVVYDHVTVPMMLEQWNEMVANGRMDAAQVERMSAFFADNPSARWLMVAQQAIVWPVIAFLTALVVWFGGGFVLGTRFRYRHALEVVSWTGLVKLPALLLTFALAWQRESFQGVHLGLGILIPEGDPPTKLQMGLSTFLDSIGPFDAWWIVVGVIGVAALSGAPRRNVAWVLVALYLALGAFFAAVAALFSPGA